MLESIRIILGASFEFNESLSGWIGVVIQLATISLIIYGYRKWKKDVHEQKKYDELHQLHKMLIRGYSDLKNYRDSLELSFLNYQFILQTTSNRDTSKKAKDISKLQIELENAHNKFIENSLTDIRLTIETLDQIYGINSLKNKVENFLLHLENQKKDLKERLQKTIEEAVDDKYKLTIIASENAEVLTEAKADLDSSVKELKKQSKVFH